MPDSAEQQDLVAKLHQDKLPAWKQTAGRTFEGMVEAVLGALGIDQGTPAAAAGGVLSAIMPMSSPLRLAGNRAKVFERLLGEAPSDAAREALGAAIKKHPRLTSHYTDVKPYFTTDSAAGVELSRRTPEIRATLNINPLATSATDVGRSIAHESGHMADALRVADRARHAGIADKPGDLFTKLYQKAGEGVSYNKNPWETRARTAEAAHDIPRRPGRQAEAQLLARDPTNSMLNVAKSLNDYDAMEIILANQARTLPAVRRQGTPDPGTLDQLLRSLDSRFVR